MKKNRFADYFSRMVAIFFILGYLTGCEKTDYDLIDPDTAGIWTQFTSGNSGLLGNEVRDMVVDMKGNLWVTCYGSGLAKYSNGTWTKFNTSNSDILSNNVTATESTSDGRIIVGTNNGVAILNASGQWSSYNDPLVTTMDVYCVRMISDGSLWIGTYNEGFYINKATVYSHSLSGFTVYSIEEDQSGNVWMGTSNGLLKWDGISWTNISNTAGLPSGSVTSLFVDSKNRLWIGVLDADKVYLLDNTGIHGISLLTGLTKNEIRDICEDKHGDIWFATYGGGLIRYDGVIPHSYKTYNAFTSGLFAEDKINCIVKDMDGNMWFGLTTKGLVKYTLPLY